MLGVGVLEIFPSRVWMEKTPTIDLHSRLEVEGIIRFKSFQTSKTKDLIRKLRKNEYLKVSLYTTIKLFGLELVKYR